MSRIGHLARRFATSLRARPLDDADRGFVRDALRTSELDCWARLGRADQAESVATGRAATSLLGEAADPDWLAAALLHDIGKAETGLGTIGRSLATVAATIAGARRARAWTGSFGRYVNHDELGSARLAQAGARSAAVSWAAVHHRPERWARSGIPIEICRILATADGEQVRQ